VMSASAFAARSEMEVLTQQGISRTDAKRALMLQQRVVETKLASKIRTALGGAYAGVWFEPATAKFYVAVTSNASRQAVMRLATEAGLGTGVVATPVHSTLRALIAVQTEWNRRFASLLAGGDAMTAIALQSNAVEVRLSASVSPSDRATLLSAATKADLNILVSVEPSPKLRVVPEAKKTCEKAFTALKAFCEEAITAGVGIRTPGATGVECTAGPELIAGIVTYMLTAGHCIAANATVAAGEVFEGKQVASAFPVNGEFKEIGKEGKRYNNKERDMAEVLVVPKSQKGAFAERLPIPVPALVTEWTASPEKPHAVEGQEEADVGQIICHEGAATGEQCGKVLTLYVTGAGVENLVETSACSAGRDSGGPYFIYEKGKLLMVGMHIGKPTALTPGCGEPNPRTVFAPLVGLFGAEEFGILNTFTGQSLLTTANENRAKSEKEEKELKEKEEKEEKEFKEKEEKEKAVAPTLLFLGSEGPTVLLNSKAKEAISSELQSSVAKITAKKLTVELTLLQGGGSVGSYEAKFFEAEKAGTKCETAGAAEAGEVEVGEKGKSEPISLQYTKIGSPLEAGEVFTVKSVKITCGAVKVTLNGTLLGSITPLNTEVAAGSNTVAAGLTCSATSGKPSKTSYINDKGEATKAALTAVSGGIEGEACELVGTAETSTIKLLPTKMIEIMG
jgi:hypothetical protein